jgi:hypothetical protein
MLNCTPSVPPEIDLVTLCPRTACLTVASRVDQHEGTLLEGVLGLSASTRDGPDPPWGLSYQQRGEQQVVDEGICRLLDATPPTTCTSS